MPVSVCCEGAPLREHEVPACPIPGRPGTLHAGKPGDREDGGERAERGGITGAAAREEDPSGRRSGTGRPRSRGGAWRGRAPGERRTARPQGESAPHPCSGDRGEGRHLSGNVLAAYPSPQAVGNVRDAPPPQDGVRAVPPARDRKAENGVPGPRPQAPGWQSIAEPVSMNRVAAGRTPGGGGCSSPQINASRPRAPQGGPGVRDVTPDAVGALARPHSLSRLPPLRALPPDAPIASGIRRARSRRRPA